MNINLVDGEFVQMKNLIPEPSAPVTATVEFTPEQPHELDYALCIKPGDSPLAHDQNTATLDMNTLL